MEVRHPIMLLSASEGEGRNSDEQDIMQVWCMVNIFTLRIHKYNIINGIVGIRFSTFCVKEGYQFPSFIEELLSMILCGGGRKFIRLRGDSQGNDV